MVIIMKTIEVGTVSREEIEKIRKIYFRKTALQELISIVSMDNEELYQKILDDLAVSNIKMSEWWIDISKKKGWEYGTDCSWNIDFRTGAISVSEA